MRHTIGYKQGYIHLSHIEGNEVIRVQVDKFAYALEVRSLQAAKNRITRYSKGRFLKLNQMKGLNNESK